MPDRDSLHRPWGALTLLTISCLALAGLEAFQADAAGTPALRYTAIVGLAIAIAVLVAGVGYVIFTSRRAYDLRRQRKQGEELFSLLVAGIAEYAIFMLDPGGRVTTWNPGAKRIKGYSAQEIIGQHYSRFFTPEDREKGIPEQILAVAARDGKYEAETWRVRKDGTRFYANAVITSLLGPSGELVGFAKITRDITEHMQQQKVLAESQAALAQSQKLQALGQLAGGIAHDFNNVIHVIKNAIAILSERLGREDPVSSKYLEMAIRNADRASAVTQRLLAFARQRPLDPKPIVANKLIQGMSDMLRQALGEGVSLETILSSGLWLTCVDASQLETAILNLVVNARDAMQRVGTLSIETANAFLGDDYTAIHPEVTPGQYVMIAVSDTGMGMTKETAARAFDPFFTTKAAGEGTGLGLSQVFGFVKQSAGHVKVDSEPGEGTTVKLYLPRLHGASAQVPQPWNAASDEAAYPAEPRAQSTPGPE